MIDLIYKTLLTIINKENQGYVSPTEFNILAHQVVSEIYRGYFEDENTDKNKENRGLVNNGYANLSFNQRQRIQEFADVINLTAPFTLPDNLYFIEEHGVMSEASESNYNTIVAEVERNQFNYLIKSSAKPTELYPIFEKYGNALNVFPSTITGIEVRYIRTPKMPNWTYVTLPSGDPMHNPADVAFQDIELHISEFSNIVISMLAYFGINLRETEVVQVAEALKRNQQVKDNG